MVKPRPGGILREIRHSESDVNGWGVGPMLGARGPGILIPRGRIGRFFPKRVGNFHAFRLNRVVGTGNPGEDVLGKMYTSRSIIYSIAPGPRIWAT